MYTTTMKFLQKLLINTSAAGGGEACEQGPLGDQVPNKVKLLRDGGEGHSLPPASGASNSSATTTCLC